MDLGVWQLCVCVEYVKNDSNLRSDLNRSISSNDIVTSLQ